MISSQNFSRIAASLRQFGCSERETQIYLHSLTIGPASVQELARQLNQNRITVHSAVEQLIRQGFLFETRKGKRRLVVAEEPAILHQLLQKKERDLQLTKANIDFVVQIHSSMKRQDGGIPTVKLYEGVGGLKRMLEETLSAKGEVLVFTYVDLFSQLLSPRYLENYYARRAKKGISTRLIFPTAEFGKKVNMQAEEYKMKIRFLSPELKWKSGIFSWNSNIAIQSFTEGKVTCTIIENEDIAHFYRNVIFELCWKQAKSL